MGSSEEESGRRRETRARVWGLVLLALIGATGAGVRREALPSALAARSLLLDVELVGERLVAVGEWGHVVLSDDGGVTWRQARSVPTQATLTAVFFVTPEEGWAVGHDAVILHTRNAGETWAFEHSAPDEEVPLLGVWFENRRHGFAVGAFGMMFETRDGGATWERRSLGSDDREDEHLNDVFPGPDGSLLVAAEFGRVFRSKDGGASWERLQLPYSTLR